MAEEQKNPTAPTPEQATPANPADTSATPTTPDVSTPETPVADTPEMSTMETLNKLMDTLSHEFLTNVQQTQTDSRDASRKEQKNAMDKTIAEFSEQFGISKDNLRAVVAYLRMDPSANGPGYQKEAEKRLNVVLDAMAEHTPKGEIDRETLDAWKTKVAEASQTLKDLQGEWNELAAAKEVCEQERTRCAKILKEQKNQLNESNERLEEIRALLEEKKQELVAASQALDPSIPMDENHPFQKTTTELAELQDELTRQQDLVESTKAVVEQTSQELEDVRRELSDTEFALKQKSFEVRSAMMVCALQEQMSSAIEHMPLLDDKTQEAQELVEDVKDVKRDYEELAQQYKGHRIALGEKLQQSPNRLLQDIGDALIDWKIKDIQRGNEQDINHKIFTMDMAARWDKFKTEIGGIFNKTSNAYIERHSNKAMKELAEINKLDKRIKRQTERIEKQAIREVRLQNRDKRLARAEIENSPQYKAKVKELAEARTAKTREKREKHIGKFQEHVKKVRESNDRRQDVYKKHLGQRKELNHKIDVMRDFGDIGDKAQFSFSKDLKTLLPQSMKQINQLLDKSTEFSNEKSFDDGPSR